MVDVSVERYNFILSKLKEARSVGNKRMTAIWKGKLESWQQAYGAYAPISVKN